MSSGYEAGCDGFSSEGYQVPFCSSDYSSGRASTGELAMYFSFGDCSEYKGSLIPDWDSIGAYDDKSCGETYKPKKQPSEQIH